MSTADDLDRLAALRKTGVLTDEEFADVTERMLASHSGETAPRGPRVRTILLGIALVAASVVAIYWAWRALSDGIGGFLFLMAVVITVAMLGSRLPSGSSGSPRRPR